MAQAGCSATLHVCVKFAEVISMGGLCGGAGTGEGVSDRSGRAISSENNMVL